MHKLSVKKAFVFSRKNGSEVHFKPGVHDIDDEIATHPFIVEHKANGHAELIAHEAGEQSGEGGGEGESESRGKPNPKKGGK